MKNFSSPLFRGFTDTEIEQMRNSTFMRSASFTKGEIIFRSGNVIHEFGIVVSGSVHIENIDLWGNRSLLSNVASGQVFGETYALCDEPMMVNAIASEESQILFLDMDSIMNSTNESESWHMKFIKNMLQISVQKNLILSNRIFCTTAKTIRSRLLTYLSGMSVKSGSTMFQIPFDRQQLADYLTVDRSALSKELGKMRNEGLIDFHKSTFKLNDTK